MTRLLLSNDTEFTIREALFSTHFGRMLLSFKDIQENNYHTETTKENGMEYLCITFHLYGQKRILETVERLLNGLYISTIRSIEANHVTDQKLVD